MSNIGCLMAIFRMFLKLSTRYGQMTPEQRSKTAYFGIYSILTAIFAGGLFLLGLWGIIELIAIIDTSGLGAILITVFIVILAICELVLIIELILGGVMGIVYQLRCNKRPIGWIALAVFIVALVGMILGMLLIINATGVQLF